jgi:hypothetical protein
MEESTLRSGCPWNRGSIPGNSYTPLLNVQTVSKTIRNPIQWTPEATSRF